METESFDLIVIGAGSAAREAARVATAEHGASVAMVERDLWGGSCPNVACKPAKAYLVAAELARDVTERASEIGLVVGEPRIDLARTKAWKDELVGTQESWLEFLNGRGYATIAGTATFVDPRTLRVGERTISSDRILIASGSLTAVPPIEGIDAIDWLDHVSILELIDVPESLLVLGAGAVGLELAQAFSRFGSQVIIVETMERISPASDHEASTCLRAALEEDGIEIVTGTAVEQLARRRDAVVGTLADGRELSVSNVLVAAGRRPNIDGLELEAAGVETTKAGVAVDEHMRTNVPGVWAAGDVVAIAQYTPAAQYEARIAIADMFAQEPGRAADHSNLPTAIFTDPELAAVGLTEEQAREQGLAVETVAETAVQRMKLTGTKHGLFKIVFDGSSRRVLGVHAVSRGASDVVQGLAVAMNLSATVDDLARAHHAFPTYAEGVKAAAEQAV